MDSHSTYSFAAVWGHGDSAPPVHRLCISEQRHTAGGKEVNSPFVDSLPAKNDLESQRPGGVRDKKAQVMGGVGWSKSHRRGGLFPDHRDSKMTGDKRTGVVAGSSMKKSKCKIHGHPAAESKQTQTTARVLGPSPLSRESAFSQDRRRFQKN